MATSTSLPSEDNASPLLKGLARLPGLTGFVFYYWLLPTLRSHWSILSPFLKMVILQQERFPEPPLAIFTGFSLLALFYQARIRRTWWDTPFLLINSFFVFLGTIILLLAFLHIDLMPRQS